MQLILSLLISLLIVCDAVRLPNYDEDYYNYDRPSSNAGRLPSLDYANTNHGSGNKFAAGPSDENENDQIRTHLFNDLISDSDYGDYARTNQKHINSLDYLDVNNIPEKKSSRSRASASSNNDRGNRNASVLFESHMIQCESIQTHRDLKAEFSGAGRNMEFHESIRPDGNIKQWECKQVRDERRVRNPCEWYPRGHQRLCYFRHALNSGCETLTKTEYIWMRERVGENTHGPWFAEKIEVNAGCYCNIEFIH